MSHKTSFIIHIVFGMLFLCFVVFDAYELMGDGPVLLLGTELPENLAFITITVDGILCFMFLWKAHREYKKMRQEKCLER